MKSLEEQTRAWLQWIQETRELVRLLDSKLKYRIVRQPNGMLARFSEESKMFDIVDMSEFQAMEAIEEGLDIDIREVSSAWNFVEKAQKDADLTQWRRCLEMVLENHGEGVALNVVKICATDHETERGEPLI